MSQSVQERGQAVLAEGALRNLHLDCAVDGAGDQTFTSRMLHYSDDALIIADLSSSASQPKVRVGDRLVCSCRLGSDIVRFTAGVAGRQRFQLNPTKRIGALVLTDLGAPTVIQRRRYFRVSMARHESADVTLWIVQNVDDHSIVCGQIHGTVADLSGGGAGVVIRSNELLEDLGDKELWARFSLPGENESLIFRVNLRRVKHVENSRTYHAGLEFDEYIDPGRHQRVIDDIVRFVSRQERTALKRRKDR